AEHRARLQGGDPGARVVGERGRHGRVVRVHERERDGGLLDGLAEGGRERGVPLHAGGAGRRGLGGQGRRRRGAGDRVEGHVHPVVAGVVRLRRERRRGRVLEHAVAAAGAAGEGVEGRVVDRLEQAAGGDRV